MCNEEREKETVTGKKASENQPLNGVLNHAKAVNYFTVTERVFLSFMF